MGVDEILAQLEEMGFQEEVPRILTPF